MAQAVHYISLAVLMLLCAMLHSGTLSAYMGMGMGSMAMLI